MTIEQTLQTRAGSKCELCTADANLSVFEVPPVDDAGADKCVLLCDTCKTQVQNPADADANHWRCLNDSMWNPEAAVQVVAWRQLTALQANGESWAQDMLDMLYLEDDVKVWAESGAGSSDDEDEVPAFDSNGAQLAAGDTVTLIKDLQVKGGGFTAKRGTAVRGISLTGNPEQIEGRVNGVRIVLLTKFLKKA